MKAQWVDGAMAHTPHRRVILDMGSSKSPVHGEQERAAYNGHFSSVCYHPLFVFNQFGDLRRGQAASWECTQRPQLAGRTGANPVPLRADGSAPVLPGRCRLRQARGLRVLGGTARPLRHQTPRQRGAAMGDRSSVEEAGGKAAEETHHLV